MAHLQDDLMDGEFICFYNESCPVFPNKVDFEKHLRKCRQTYKGLMINCRFNGKHIVPMPEVLYHQRYCPDRHCHEIDDEDMTIVDDSGFGGSIMSEADHAEPSLADIMVERVPWQDRPPPDQVAPVLFEESNGEAQGQELGSLYSSSDEAEGSVDQSYFDEGDGQSM